MKKNKKNTQSNEESDTDKAIRNLSGEIDKQIKKIFANKKNLTIKDVVDYCRKDKYPELINECKIKINETLLKVKDINFLIFYQKKATNRELRKLIADRIRKLKKTIKQNKKTNNTSKNQQT